jgi:hypothetical protein
VPYLPVELFQRHAVERCPNTQIHIPDRAWPPLFDFFAAYHWQLDERPVGAANAITPDILGAVFEQYINQKEFGAYYTEPDVTGYIARATILPALFDAVQQVHTSWWATVRELLRDNPTRYIPAPLGHGMQHPLPPQVAIGLHDTQQRGAWNDPTPPTHGLPGETWRETLARRGRYQSLCAQLANQQCATANDLVAANLDLLQLLHDLIAGCGDPVLLWSLWQALNGLRVLDPTCGSGAFLLAALALLEPLYAQCLAQMNQLATEAHPGTLPFGAVLARSGQGTAQRWFVLASIMGHNLYGVDLMPEAVELCRLRLLLKLVAQCDDAAQVATLPDLTAHIRVGNALVGFLATPTDAHGQPVLDADELNRALAHEYAIDHRDGTAYGRWLATHQPLHWCAAFNEVMAHGGFDAVIGNPPYLAYGAVRHRYRVRGYATEACANVYAFTVERALALLRRGGRCGMIVPIASVSTTGMAALQALYAPLAQWHSHYAVRPGKLFVGVDMNLTISLLHKQPTAQHTYVTGYQRWSSGARGQRPYLFATLAYTPNPRLAGHANAFPKLGSPLEARLLQQLLNHRRILRAYTVPSGTTLYYHSGGRYWRKALLEKLSSHYKALTVQPAVAPIVFGLLNSQLFYWYWISNSNCMDVVSREVLNLPVFDLDAVDPAPFAALMQHLLAAYATTATTRVRRGTRINTSEVNVAAGHAKPVLDAIDRLLASHYGLDDEALDFVLNYDIKYRLPRSTA